MKLQQQGAPNIAQWHRVFRFTLLLQLNLNSFPDAYLVTIELILCIMKKIVLSHIWCDFISDKMSIKEVVECSCSNKDALNIATNIDLLYIARALLRLLALYESLFFFNYYY